MNSRTKGRTTRIRAGIIVAAAAAVITGGGLTLGGLGSSHHAAAPAGAVRGQNADFADGGTQCADLEQQISAGRNVNAADALRCDETEIQADPTKVESNVCVAVNAQVVNGDLSVLDLRLMLACQAEELKAPDSATGGDANNSSLCKGADITQQGGGNVLPDILAVCPNAKTNAKNANDPPANLPSINPGVVQPSPQQGTADGGDGTNQ